MSMDSIIEVFYHLNKMLIATKHIANNNFVYLNFVSSDNDIKQNNRNNGIADDTGNRRN